MALVSHPQLSATALCAQLRHVLATRESLLVWTDSREQGAPPPSSATIVVIAAVVGRTDVARPLAPSPPPPPIPPSPFALPPPILAHS